MSQKFEKLILLERLEDDLPIGRIWVADTNGVPVPRAEIGGVVCDIETKQTLLDAGLASCNPLSADLAFNWPMQARVKYTHSDGSVEERIMEAVCADESLVATVKKFYSLALEGAAIAGMDLSE